MEYFVKVLKNYATFTGRARRKEFWMFSLVGTIILVALGILGGLLTPAIGSVASLPSTLYSLAILVPFIAVGVRRMHDIDKDWWFILIPVYGFVLACAEGTKGSNQYGPDPKAATALSH